MHTANFPSSLDARGRAPVINSRSRQTVSSPFFIDNDHRHNRVQANFILGFVPSSEASCDGRRIRIYSRSWMYSSSSSPLLLNENTP